MAWGLWGLVVLWGGYAVFGRRWRIAPRLTAAIVGRERERVVAVVPARNEAAELPRTLGALLAQRHAGLHVVLVDDNSTDGTADVARGIAATQGASDRLTVITAPELPPGWTGKVWAQQQGVAHPIARDADWIWLTDADIHQAPDVLERLLATAFVRGRDLVSIMARLRCDTAYERLLIPAFTYFFAMIYSFDRTAVDHARDAGAAGGCVLVRRTLLAQAGGIAAIRDAVIDDCALARVCKDAGGRLWIGYDPGVNSTRGYDTLQPIWDMVARSAYTQLLLSPALLAGCVLGLAYVFLLPIAVLLLGSGVGRLCGLVAYAAMVRTYLPMVTYLGCSPGWALAIPLSAALYTAMTISSAWRYHFGTGAAWKGRAYGLDVAVEPPADVSLPPSAGDRIDLG